MQQDIILKIKEDFNKSLISTKNIIPDFSFIDKNSINSIVFNDNRQYPFYYHFGKHFKSKSMVDVGVGLGINSCCYLKSSNDCEFVGFRNKKEGEFYPLNIAYKNIKRYLKKDFVLYNGHIYDDPFLAYVNLKKYDFILVSDKLTYYDGMEVLEFFWDKMIDHGIILVDYINDKESNKEFFNNFAKVKQRETLHFDTRYGIGIIEK